MLLCHHWEQLCWYSETGQHRTPRSAKRPGLPGVQACQESRSTEALDSSSEVLDSNSEALDNSSEALDSSSEALDSSSEALVGRIAAPLAF